MNCTGAIIIIEDDPDDQFFLEEAFDALAYPSKRIYFSDGLQAMEYLETTDEIPFFILSDINMPKINGLELRERMNINDKLRETFIPYIFFSTAAHRQMVADAYRLNAQGFFVKEPALDKLSETLRVIIQYWKICLAP